MTTIFISHSSHDNKMAMRLDAWLKSFQFIGKVWIDIRELRPGMELTNSIRQGIDKSDIVIIIVSRKSMDSQWVKEEIEYSLKYAEKGEKIVIPILYKITSRRIPIRNDHIVKLLERIYVTLDENLVSIRNLIPSLIPTHYILEVLINGTHVDETLLIDKLRTWPREQKLYVLLNHEAFDKDLIAVLEEYLQSNYSDECKSKLNRIKENFLPIFWLNISYALSIYVVKSILNGVSYELLTTSILNLTQAIFNYLSKYLFDLDFLFVDNNKKRETKKMLEEHYDYLWPRGIYGGEFWYICKLYYDSSISPDELVKFSFTGNKVHRQIAHIDKRRYQSAMQYLPTWPPREIMDSDWYGVIVPQFLSYYVFTESRKLNTLDKALMKPIGLDMKDYDEVNMD